MDIRVHGAGLLPASSRRTALIGSAARAALGAAARRAGELNVIFLRRGPMRTLNREYLGHDYDTDVIAFNYSRSRLREREASPFGDVYISVDQARRQARDLGHPLLTELLTLAVHGALHLIGYRDGTLAERRRMFARQDRVLSRLWRG